MMLVRALTFSKCGGQAMDYRVGDAIFNYSGRPGIVVDKKLQTGEFVIKPPSESLKEVQKRGYINGLSPAERQDFNEVMDRVRELQDPVKKIEELGTQIDAKQGGDVKARQVAKYLNAEMQHIMISNHIQNREYKMDEFKIGE